MSSGRIHQLGGQRLNATGNPSGVASVRPHGVTEVALVAGGKRQYSYDANGNLTGEVILDVGGTPVPNTGRTLAYTSFNLPGAISTTAATSSFNYGPDLQRVRQISSISGTTIYLNPDNTGALYYEKDIKPDASIEHRHFITAAGTVVALLKQTAGGTTISYLHRDNLGSTTTASDGVGAVSERLAYEPFGKRRFPAGMDDPADTIIAVTTERGFTNHEHMDELGLIHMNGRVYEPTLMRFTSADPTLPNAFDLQSYNRYSYVRNNPLRLLDPSGFEDVASDKGWPSLFDRSGQGSRIPLSTLTTNAGNQNYWVKPTTPATQEPGFGTNQFNNDPKAWTTDSTANQNERNSSFTWVHGGLNLASFAPSFWGAIPSALDGVAYAAEGDRVGAGISFGAAALGMVSNAGWIKAAGMAAREGAGVAKGVEQGRDAFGRFLPKAGGEVVPGSLAEQSVWDAVRQKPGWNVIEGRVSVRNAAGNLRVYDGAAVSPRGRVIGLEVKSGGAPYRGAQSAFDAGVSTINPAVGVGANKGLEIERSLLIRRP